VTQLAPVQLERSSQEREVRYSEAILATSDTRLAATMLVFKAQLLGSCPLEWVDCHKSREDYVRYLERPNEPAYAPKPQVTFNFDARSCPKQSVAKGFNTPLEQINAQLEAVLNQVPRETKLELAEVISQMIARCCHEALLHREELVKLLKSMPRNAKFDQIKSGRRIVRLGKNCSPQVRSHYLSKLPP
jgi:hypothetical protein